MRKLTLTSILLSSTMFTSTLSAVPNTFYVDNINGDDINDGRTQATAWRSIKQVNSTPLVPNTLVRFKRGGVWNEQLKLQSGSSAGVVSYDAYGTGPKPALEATVTTTWTSLGNNLWQSTTAFPPKTTNGLPPGNANDIANILWGGYDNPTPGIEKWSLADLHTTGDWVFSTYDWRVIIYSATNPTTAFPQLKLVIDRTLIDSSASYATVQNLALRFAGANGISNNGSIGDHLTFSDLDISWIGGGNLQGSGIRYGAGIVFWNNSHDNVVERNRIWQIYDSGITNQGIAETSPISVYNLTYRNNLILNASMSIESWLNSTAVNGSTMHDIQIYNNSMANPNSWRGGQNPINGIAGHGLMIGASPNVSAYNITVENNAFTSFASNVALGMNTFDWAKGQMTMDYNDWYDNVPMQVYTTVAPHLWQAFNTWTAAYPAEQHGIQAHPHYANMFGLDFHLLEGSALIGKGVNLYTKGVVEDFDHNPRPTIGPFDIGAFQTQK